MYALVQMAVCPSIVLMMALCTGYMQRGRQEGEGHVSAHAGRERDQPLARMKDSFFMSEVKSIPEYESEVRCGKGKRSAACSDEGFVFMSEIKDSLS